MRAAASSLVLASAVHADLSRLRAFDCSWFLGGARNGRTEFESVGHVPGACFIDIDEVADHSTGLPHMLPSRVAFEEAASRWGLTRSDDVVVYDAQFMTSFRVWWMFKRVFEHERVRVMDGGFPAWLAGGLPVERGAERPRLPSQYVAAAHRTDLVASINDVVAPDTRVLDARPAGRFRGQGEEPRKALHKGHVPGSINIPWPSFHRDPAKAELGFQPPEKLRELLAPALAADKQLVTSCGSGVSACIINFALAELGRNKGKLYDGSWAEYGNIATAKIEK